VREEGPAEPFRRFLYRRGLRRRLALFVRPRLDRFATDRQPPADVVPGRLEPGDLDEYLALRPDQRRGEIEARLAAGHVGLVVRHRGRIVGHSWIGLGDVALDDLACTMRLAPDAAFVYDDFVVPEMRSRYVLRSASPLRRDVIRARGMRWNVSVLLPENRLAFGRVGRHRPVFVGEVVRAWPHRRLVLRLDRELAAGWTLPVAFHEPDGRPARVRRVAGPLLLDRSPWITPHEAPPVFPLSASLDRAGWLRRRLVSVYDAASRTRAPGRIPLEASVLEPETLAGYLALRPDQTRAEVEARWRAGHVGFVGRFYDELVAAAWLAPAGGAFEDLGVTVRLGPEAAGAWDEFVAPRWRRHHLLDRVDDLRSAHALDRGWKRCVALVPPEVPGAWMRLRRNERPVRAELRRTPTGARVRLAPGVAASDLPCTFVVDGRELAPER